MRALVVDDHPLIHEVMHAVLRRALNPCAIYHASGLDAALARARQSRRLDLVVLDLMLPDCDKLEALTRLRAELPDASIVVLSAVDSPEVIREAIAAGAKGYIPKTSSTALVQVALSIVAAGGTYVPPEALRAMPTEALRAMPNKRADELLALPAVKLSVRQVDVLKRIVRGLPNRRIADELAISENTVKHHAHEVFKALGVSTRTEALVAAMRQGLRFD
jgi:DNA-binding NarL/FixJ family response regulator